MDQLPCHRMRGQAHRDGRSTRRHNIGQLRPPRQDQRQRPRPEPLRQSRRHLGPLRGDTQHVRCLGDVDDERIVGWPPLRRENACHGSGVEGIGAQTVDRLGRERDQPAGAQDFGGSRQGVGE
jgi:hypothetical protein